MFITLLLATLVIAILISAIIAKLFHPSIDKILNRIIADEISVAWLNYIKFAIYVVGISSGVRVWELERYISPNQFAEKSQIIELTTDRWVLEVYRTIIETLQGIAWTLLLFFIVSLIGYVIIRVFEIKKR